MKTKKSFIMNKDYDMQNDSLFMYNIDDYNYKESVELGKNFILDFDENNVPVAVEILEASKLLNIEKYSLKHLTNFKMEISISVDSITIDAEFKVLVHLKEVAAPIKLEVPNELNFPQVQSEFALTA